MEKRKPCAIIRILNSLRFSKRNSDQFSGVNSVLKTMVYMTAALSFFALHPGEEADAAERCKIDLFSTKTTACNAEPKQSNRSLLQLYSRQDIKPNEINQPLKIEIQSENKTLSARGPDVRARLEAYCGPGASPAVKLVFPGYPMFLENSSLTVTMAFGSDRGYLFSTVPGQDMFEMVVTDQRVLRQLTGMLSTSQVNKVSFSSKDQENSFVKADFDFSKFKTQISKFKSTCL